MFASKQTALDGSAPLFEFVPACRTEHFANNFTALQKGGDDSTSMFLGKFALCFVSSTDQIKVECV